MRRPSNLTILRVCYRQQWQHDRSGSSHAGKARLRPCPRGALGGVLPRVRQVFEAIAPGSAADDADARFNHFSHKVWPRMKESGATGACGVGGYVLVVVACKCAVVCGLVP